MRGYGDTVQRSRPVLSATDHYRQRGQRRRAKANGAPGSEPTLKQSADSENLILVFRDRKWNGGRALGPKGYTPSDLEPGGVTDCMHERSRRILHSEYPPSRQRLMTTAQASGRYAGRWDCSLMGRRRSLLVAARPPPGCRAVLTSPRPGCRVVPGTQLFCSTY